MRQALDKTLRKKLEDTVVKARDIVEQAVFDALQRLGVAEAQAPSYLSEEERALRNKLRAHARQLGDKLKDGKQETERLINEMAYEHWHRMLFARYLEQNNLLMYDEYTPVTLDECFELAEEEPDCKDGWELAGRLAQKMLPQIFRVDSPVFEVKLSLNRLFDLEKLILEIDLQVFEASDALGWSYQYWQLKKKKKINAAEVKVTEHEISPVTQLFTEPYMVQSLLDNSVGAWWVNKIATADDFVRSHDEREVKSLFTTSEIPLKYLRLIERDDTSLCPAAGIFPQWPEALKDFRAIDPCCGSGHFLVALFLMLVPMRMKLESISANDAIDRVLSENIFGLELDKRCVEVAVFALALEAWRYPNSGGFRKLPTINVAWVGFTFDYNDELLERVSKNDPKVKKVTSKLFELLTKAPLLGSLIDPVDVFDGDDVILEHVLEEIRLCQAFESNNKDTVLAFTDVYSALSILGNRYHLVATNPPYLMKNKQSKLLLDFCSKYYPEGVADLATVFFKRYQNFLLDDGVHLSVTPLNWLFIKSYTELRRDLSLNGCVRMVVKVGSGATAKDSWDVLRALTVITKEIHKDSDLVTGIDVSAVDEFSRAEQIISEPVSVSDYSMFKKSPDSRFVIHENRVDVNIEDIARSFAGLQSGDYPQYGRKFWELNKVGSDWEFQQSTFEKSSTFVGSEHIFKWDKGNGSLVKSPKAYVRGLGAHGKAGIVVTQTRSLPVTNYLGGFFDNNVAVIVPEKKEDLEALWVYCESDEYHKNVRKLDEKLGVTNATLAKVPFDKEKWASVAREKFPRGLPAPFSNIPLQSIFHGHPCATVLWDDTSKTTVVGNLRQNDAVLQIAVARLLGYQWPAELDPDMELAPEMREVMKKNADFAGLIDDDGIVCIPAVRGEKTAAKRLEAILHKAYGDEWTSSVEQNLLKAVKAKDLESWLRDKFFDQHSKLFQHRPFIWQIWDGSKDGFSALVNYHKLDYKGLERLIYTYLDDWISTQKRDLADGKDGADIRLTAAENLKKQLEAILAGEKGLDIFVRWKPLEDQPIGWNPDLNDGVRLNIRPFMLCKDIGKKGAGVLRTKPNVKWEKSDRGTDVPSAPWFELGPVYGEKLGARINYHHLTLDEKKAAREQVND